MTIQISVTLWTVICFCLLMLILRNLLFKPVLRVLDDRKARLEQAAQKKAAYAAMEQEHRVITEQQANAFAKEQKHKADRQLEAIRFDSKKALEAAQEQRLTQVETYRVTAEQMHQEILQTLQGHTAQLAAAFAQNLIKD